MADVISIDDADVLDYFFDQGLTDGLPIVPPTVARVHRMIAGGGLEKDVVLGGIPARSVEVTVLESAVNAVMAGCKPEYFPVVIAATRAVLSPEYGGHAMFASTSGGGVCVLVSGPLAEELKIHGRNGALGSGFRANATIGRSLRLMAVNTLGNATLGGMDGSSQGNPGKYSLCFSEDPPPTPWPTLRAEKGFGAADTTVTIMVAEAPRQVANHLSLDPVAILNTFAVTMRCAGIFGVGKRMQGIVVLGPEHAGALVRAGWSKDDVREYLMSATRVTHEELRAAGITIEHGTTHDMEAESDGKTPTFEDPADLMVVTAGGDGLGWSSYIPGAAPKVHTKSVTRLVQLP